MHCESGYLEPITGAAKRHFLSPLLNKGFGSWNLVRTLFLLQLCVQSPSCTNDWSFNDRGEVLNRLLGQFCLSTSATELSDDLHAMVFIAPRSCQQRILHRDNIFSMSKVCELVLYHHESERVGFPYPSNGLWLCLDLNAGLAIS